MNNNISNESLEDAAHAHHRKGYLSVIGSNDRSLYEEKNNSFRLGASWKEEKDKAIIDKFSSALEHLIDSYDNVLAAYSKSQNKELHSVALHNAKKVINQLKQTK